MGKAKSRRTWREKSRVRGKDEILGEMKERERKKEQWRKRKREARTRTRTAAKGEGER